MGCCAYTTDKGERLEITIPNILKKVVNAEFVDISLNSEEDQEQKIKTQTNDSKNDTTGESSIS